MLHLRFLASFTLFACVTACKSKLITSLLKVSVSGAVHVEREAPQRTPLTHIEWQLVVIDNHYTVLC